MADHLTIPQLNKLSEDELEKLSQEITARRHRDKAEPGDHAYGQKVFAALERKFVARRAQEALKKLPEDVVRAIRATPDPIPSGSVAGPAS